MTVTRNDSISKKVKSAPPAHQSLIAGMIAGGIEGVVTYPTEFVKTQLQLQNSSNQKLFKGPIDVVVKTVREKGVFGLYRGLSALAIGNSSKAGVRFLAFDQLKRLLADSSGNTSGVRMAAAGLGAGMAEAILVVTPSETIKTKLIHDQNRPNPRFKGLSHGVAMIIKEEGFRGIYRGLGPVIARQGANSAVRMSTYGLIRDSVASRYPLHPVTRKPFLPWYASFITGGLAGIVTVYTTMPLDVVKTRMQSLEGSKLYRNAIDCLVTIARKEGIPALWKGATPRLGRLILSGGIVFSVYEQVIRVFESIP